MAKTKKKQMPKPMDKERSYKPEISFSAKELGAVKKWNVGGKYKLAITVEMTSQSNDQYGDGTIVGRFKVLSVKVIGGKKSAGGNPKVEAEKSDENTKYGY